VFEPADEIEIIDWGWGGKCPEMYIDTGALLQETGFQG
jgi:hypothetical protein